MIVFWLGNVYLLGFFWGEMGVELGSQHLTDCPETCCVDQDDFELTDRSACLASQGLKGMLPHAQLPISSGRKGKRFLEILGVYYGVYLQS